MPVKAGGTATPPGSNAPEVGQRAREDTLLEDLAARHRQTLDGMSSTEAYGAFLEGVQEMEDTDRLFPPLRACPDLPALPETTADLAQIEAFRSPMRPGLPATPSNRRPMTGFSTRPRRFIA